MWGLILALTLNILWLNNTFFNLLPYIMSSVRCNDFRSNCGISSAAFNIIKCISGIRKGHNFLLSDLMQNILTVDYEITEKWVYVVAYSVTWMAIGWTTKVQFPRKRIRKFPSLFLPLCPRWLCGTSFILILIVISSWNPCIEENSAGMWSWPLTPLASTLRKLGDNATFQHVFMAGWLNTEISLICLYFFWNPCS